MLQGTISVETSILAFTESPWHLQDALAPPAPPYCRMVQGDNVVTSSLACTESPWHLQDALAPPRPSLLQDGAG